MFNVKPDLTNNDAASLWFKDFKVWFNYSSYADVVWSMMHICQDMSMDLVTTSMVSLLDVRHLEEKIPFHSRIFLTFR